MLKTRGNSQEQEMTALKTMLEEVLKRLPPTKEKAAGNPTGGAPNREGNYELTANGQQILAKPADLPSFDGLALEGWIRQAERYFHLNSVPDANLFHTLAVYMEGAALEWFIWMNDRFPFRDRQDFKSQLAKRF